ncbi:hypothetical protein IWQ57_000480 [Coemansia nantahalensis]|uniref:Uncharacterized protein n=1 Tax=Coemansia nantahalensis TaxID=2789366 RepID=A0ACC1K7H1_9FUNG|nr:hypothetical protein IWQ57_000480 [Coemansia nantahalensis]
MCAKSRSGPGKNKRNKRNRAATGASTAPGTPTTPSSRPLSVAEADADALPIEDSATADRIEEEGAVPTDARSADGDEQYSVDVPSAVDSDQPATEDQLEDVYTCVGDSGVHTDNEDGEDLPEAAAPGDAAIAVNLEDSEAVLVASNLDDSMYFPPGGSGFVDEMHAIEKSHAAVGPGNAAREEDGAAVPAGAESGSRAYVVTPSAFAPEEEPETIAHIRPESAANEQPGGAEAAPGDMHEMGGSFVHISREDEDEAEDVRPAADTGTNADTMTKRDGTDKVESTAEDVIVDAKDAAKDAADKATQAAKDAADRAAKAVKDTADKAAKAAKDAGDSVDEAADSAAAKARGILSDAKKSGEKLARRALDEANAAEKALEKQAKATSPAVLRTLGVLAAALAAVSGYYFRLPGRDNQRIGFAGGVTAAIIGLGTLVTAFVRQSK